MPGRPGPAERGGLTSNRTHPILLPSDCPTDRDHLKCLRRNAVAGRSWQRSQPPRSLAIARSFEFFTAAGRTSFTWRVYLSTIESDRVGLFVTRERIEALRRGSVGATVICVPIASPTEPCPGARVCDSTLRSRTRDRHLLDSSQGTVGVSVSRAKWSAALLPSAGSEIRLIDRGLD